MQKMKANVREKIVAKVNVIIDDEFFRWKVQDRNPFFKKPLDDLHKDIKKKLSALLDRF